MTDFKTTLKNVLLTHEGVRNRVYLDTEGHPTIGVGFNLDRPDAKAKLNKLGVDYRLVRAGHAQLSAEQVKSLLTDDIDAAIEAVKKLVPNFDALSDDRKIALSDMCFNLGPTGLSKFKNMLNFVNKKDFASASAEMLKSKWATQVGKRAVYLSKLMLNG